MASQNLSIPYQDIDDRLRNIGTPADSPSESGSLHAKVKALQDEPSLISLYKSVGAKLNDETGFFELNGITDITKEQMAEIYSGSIFYHPKGNGDCSFLFHRSTIRTNVITSAFLGVSDWYGEGVNCLRMCFWMPYLEVFYASYGYNSSEKVNYALNISNGVEMFKTCSRLRKIIGVLNLINATDVRDMFLGCTALETVNIYHLKISISFKSSPNLTVEDSDSSSLGYAVANSRNTSPITITLHPTAFAKVPQSLIEKAQAKQITIASA